jgi:KipI family sensor histidine kinase inhibitor
VRTLPAGPHALLVEVDDLDAAQSLQAEIGRRRAAGWAPELHDVVPGARTVLLDGLHDPIAVAAELATWTVPPVDTDAGPLVEIPCRYDGPDLEEVASQWGVAPGEVGPIHSAGAYIVAFCGFGPGFAYLAGLPDDRAVARRSSPRPAVPAGSVALAGAFCGIYPRPSPGGWQLIGTTDVVLWDARRTPAATLTPGTRVRFVSVT